MVGQQEPRWQQTRVVFNLEGEAGTKEQKQSVQVEDTEDIVGDEELKSGPFPPWVRLNKLPLCMVAPLLEAMSVSVASTLRKHYP